MEEGAIRIDKWLWAARLFKTRAIATDAIKGGKVKMNDTPVKPSKEIKEGDIIQVQIEQLHKVVQVKSLIKNRVPAKMVPEVYTDLTHILFTFILTVRRTINVSYVRCASLPLPLNI